MRVTRVYFDGQLEAGLALSLPADSSRHLVKVLRLKAGDTLHLFNPLGEFSAVIDRVDRGLASVSLQARVRSAQEPGPALELALGLARGERMDYAVQKATELGVGRITPLYCQRGEVRLRQEARLRNKLRHWQSIAVNASEQCGRLDVPRVCNPLDFSAFVKDCNSQLRMIMDPGGGVHLGEVELGDSLCLVTGPEGGFDPGEIELARSQGFITVSLGDRILRSETAPVAALAILQHRLGAI